MSSVISSRYSASNSQCAHAAASPIADRRLLGRFRRDAACLVDLLGEDQQADHEEVRIAGRERERGEARDQGEDRDADAPDETQASPRPRAVRIILTPATPA
jgi:hypothetical protein